MKKFVLLISCALILMSNVIAAKDLKIGAVNVEKILTEAPQVVAVNESMLERFGPRKTELQELEKKIKKMQEELTKNEMVMTSDKLEATKNEIISNIKIFQGKEALLTREVTDERNQTLAVLQEQIRSIIKDIAVAEKYDIVFAEGVVHVDEKLDITNKILDRMKKAFNKK